MKGKVESDSEGDIDVAAAEAAAASSRYLNRALALEVIGLDEALME